MRNRPFHTALYTGLALLALGPLLAQPYYLNNASFEGEPQDATVPIGWFPCEPGTTPDILPGFWGVYQEAAEGETFVGLITRENGTWESITQRLPATLREPQCYTFNLDLARAPTYSGYSRPLKLRIWGGTDKCGKAQLLYESPLIEHTRWQKYGVEFVPEQPINYLIFEAFHSERSFRYAGNILLDNISPIQLCPRA
ncbi:MAG: hypothetical protein KDC54_04805 [Lewinella sp.]|nr:hypothetical protein [Lewinella sp.]